jgi:hypothetical protein
MSWVRGGTRCWRLLEAAARISTNQKTVDSDASARTISHAVDRVLSGCDDVWLAMTRVAATTADVRNCR